MSNRIRIALKSIEGEDLDEIDYKMEYFIERREKKDRLARSLKRARKLLLGRQNDFLESVAW